MSLSNFQKQARSMVSKSKDLSTKLTYQQALELIASINGYKTWAALKVTYEKADLKEKQEALKKKNDPYEYYCLNYFAHVKDSGSYFVQINKKDFAEFCLIKCHQLGYKLDQDDLIIEYAVHTKQMDDGDAGYVTDVEEIEKAAFPDHLKK